MRKARQIFLIAALLFMAMLQGNYAGADIKKTYEQKSRHILLLSSYSNGYAWSDEIIDYIGGELTTRHDHFEVNVEHLSSEYNLNPNVWIYRYNIITSAYKEHPPDILVLIGDEAWFAHRYSIIRETFGNVKVVAVAVKNRSFSKEQLENPDSLTFSDLQPTAEIFEELKVTGLLRELNINGLFEVIEGMVHPLNKLYILTDYRIQGYYAKLLAKKVIDERGDPKTEFISSQMITTDTLLEMVKGFNDSSALFISSWFTSGFGFRYSLNYVYSRISQNTKLPIFGIVGKAVESGTFTGGYFMPKNFWGDRAVAMIEEVDKRGSSAEVPFEFYKDSLFHLNWENARERNIDRSHVPKGSKIYARPFDFVRKYKAEFIIVGVIFLILIGASLFVFRSYIQVRAARIRLMDSEDNLYKALRKSQESDRLKSAFLANMSHEIRTPLNSILGFSELLSETYDEDEKRQYTKLISSSSDLLLRLIDDILDLSKIEAGTYEFVFERVDICELLEELNQIFHHKAKSGVEFIVECKFNELEIFADRKRLSQVLTNLVNNAMKFTSKGVIKVLAEIEEFDGERMVVISVEDSGMGIPKEKLESIFDRFVKLNDLSEGTGLGLTICNSIIQKHKGTIEVKSKYGTGSKFVVRIPL